MSFNDLPAVMSAPITIETSDVTVAQTTAPSMRATTARERFCVSSTACCRNGAAMPRKLRRQLTRRVVNAVRPVMAPGAPKLPGQMNLSVVALSRPNPIF